MLKRFPSLTRNSLAKALYLSFIITLLALALSLPPVQPTLAEPVSSTGRLHTPASLSADSDKVWIPLPKSGLDFRVRDLAVVGSDLYMGGRFTQTGDGKMKDLNRIVRFDTTTGTWNALPNQGLSEEVTALAMVGSDLYVGGWYSKTVDGGLTDLGSIARYDIVNDTWNALPKQGLDGNIFALATVGNNLFVGGTFDKTGDGSVNLSRIAHYNTATDTWNALPNDGLNGPVYELATYGSYVYAGGGFTHTGDGSDLRHIARYDTAADTWNALSDQGLNGDVLALTVSGTDLYVGGRFTQTVGGAATNLGNIAHYDLTNGTWNALSDQGLNNSVSVLTVVGNDLYVGGTFDQTGDGSLTNLGYIARYDLTTSTWSALPNQGLNSWVYVIAAVDSDLYIGGEFNQSGDGLVHNISRITRFGIPDPKVYLPVVIDQ